MLAESTGFEIQTLEVWGRARYLLVTEASHNTEFNEWMEEKHFFFFSNRHKKIGDFISGS